MIDWYWVFTSSLWLTGLSLLLAAASWADHARRVAGLPLRRSWGRLFGGGWSRLGGLLACAGMMLGGGAWYERALWGALALDIAYRWWRAWRGPGTAAQRPMAPIEVGAERSPGRLRRIATGIAEWIVRAEPVVLLAAAPLFLFPSLDRVAVLLLLPALVLARWSARGHPFPYTPLDWPLALMVAMVGVSLYATFDLAFSLGKIVGLLYGIAAFYAVVEWVGSPRRLGWALAAYTLAGGGLAAIAQPTTRRQWASRRTAT